MIPAHSTRCSVAVGALVVVAAMLGACATQNAPRPGVAGARPQPVTVTRLQNMVQQGEVVGVMIGEIEASGTVYRLTLEQRSQLRADGMPVAVLGLIEDTYNQAVRRDPSLATSDAKWIKIGDYWYGGAPAGWPPK